MHTTARRLLTPVDIVIILLVMLLSLLFARPVVARNPVAVITVKGETVRQIDLTTAPDEKIILDTDPQVTLRITDGKIRFVGALCPDKSCQRQGELFAPGNTAACVPAGVVVTITGDTAEQDLDAVVG